MGDSEFIGFNAQRDKVEPQVTERIAATIRSFDAQRIARLFEVAQMEVYELVALRERWASWVEANPVQAGWTWPAAWKGFKESGAIGGALIVPKNK